MRNAIRETLDQHPRLRATRIYQMARERDYAGGVVQLRRVVARLRPKKREPSLRLTTFPGEQAQVDWAHFGHVRAFEAWKGQPRVILYDNLKAAVLERRGSRVLFNPRLLELSANYHFMPRPCQMRAGNQKGRVERTIRYVRDSLWAGRSFTTPSLAMARSGWRISGAGPATTAARSPKCSARNNPACFWLRCMPSAGAAPSVAHHPRGPGSQPSPSSPIGRGPAAHARDL